ncbi:hypothetical protein ACFQV2_25580 [Actinokineospora soli]|uniref:Diaminobutyrate--2-oxoglutarate transaminase n=1 Tax=Actinokineospora soli TaxID=1048753 RepID=A0ABW2TU66_9PSEU
MAGAGDRRAGGALRRGLILEIGGRAGAVVRMLPPLNVDESTMDQALAIFRAAVAAARDLPEGVHP